MHHTDPWVGGLTNTHPHGQDVTPKTKCYTGTKCHKIGKEYKRHQVKMLHRDKMLLRDKMPLRDKMSQFMGKISHKTHQDKL
jgi:hypothetical protein